MRESMLRFYELVVDIYHEIINDPANELNFKTAGKIIADRLAEDKLIYIVGPGGHSNMATEECLCRAGMPVQLSPLIDCTNLIFGTTKTRFLQRSGNYASGLLEQYNIGKDDVMIVINAYGINYLCVDLVLKGKERGAKVIGITSSKHCSHIESNHPARHPSGKDLKDIVDIFIDCKMPYGDATIEVKGAEQFVGPTSTLCNVFCIDTLMISAVEEMIEMGASPELWRSINLPNGDEFNKAYFHNYGQRIKYLL